MSKGSTPCSRWWYTAGKKAFDELNKELKKRDKNEVTTITEVMPQFIQVKLDRAKKWLKKVTKDYLLNILNTTNLTPDGAMDLLGIPEADRAMYKNLLKKK